MTLSYNEKQFHNSKLFTIFFGKFLTFQDCTTYHQYSPVAFSVYAPQLDTGLSPHCSCTRGPVDQSQLSKAASLADAGHIDVVHINLKETDSTDL